MEAPSLDVRLIAVFLAVLDARSVSAAAVNLGMSQPGLSTALQRLRNLLGDPLFVRTSAGMSPTARGRELEEPLRAILRMVTNQVLVGKQFDPAKATNEFRIAMSDIGEFGFLPEIMAAVRRQAPHVQITSVAPRFDELEHKMEAGQIDIALGYLPDLKSASIVGSVLVHGTFRCFVGKDNPLANRDLSIEQFCAAGHIVVEPIVRSHHVFESFLQGRGIQRNVIYRTPNFLCVPQILARTDLIAAMPIAVGQTNNFWGAAPVGLPFDAPTTELKMYWHRVAHEDPSHKWFRQLIVRELKILKAANL